MRGFIAIAVFCCAAFVFAAQSLAAPLTLQCVVTEKEPGDLLEEYLITLDTENNHATLKSEDEEYPDIPLDNGVHEFKLSESLIVNNVDMQVHITIQKRNLSFVDQFRMFDLDEGRVVTLSQSGQCRAIRK